jgi:CheY-like chemotaxis protein
MAVLGRPSTRVLYFEDDPELVRLLTRILARQPGVAIESLSEGANAVEVVTERRPDLVLLDLHLSDCSGEEVLRLLRDAPATRDTPVIILSGDATPGLPERLGKAGATGFLSKPLDFQAVRAAVASVAREPNQREEPA